MTRVPFYFTYVTYERGDWFGYLMAIACLAPHVISIALFSFLISLSNSRFKRQVGILLLGQFINEALNAILKHLIREPRPMNERIDYAMPSSHSQYAGYIAVVGWMILKGNLCIHHLIRILGLIACVGVYVIVPYSRYYLDYHDARQIAVGLGIGSTFGVFWRKIVF